MQNLYLCRNRIMVDVAGADITATIDEAIRLSAHENLPVIFEFNGVNVTVCADSDPKLIYRDWHRALKGYIDKNVGPYPNPVLTDKEKASDARIEGQNERRRQRRLERYEAEARLRRKKVEAKLVNAPAIELADEDGWQKIKENNKNVYGAAVVSYAERWARLMQLEMANGKCLEDVAETTSQEANLDEDITAFIYGCAVSMLAHCWKYGERLRRWHNLKYQIGNEGEKANESGSVLNPALLFFGSK